MTSKQRTSLILDWWPSACKAQGWKTSDRDLRLRVLSLALNCKFGNVLEIRDALEMYDRIARAPLPVTGRPFRQLKSASDLNTTSDIDAVKNLLLMLADNLEATAEQGRPQDGQGRRFADRIDELLKCLALYPLITPMGRNGAYGYALKIARSKVRGLQHLTELADNHGYCRDQAAGTLEISPSEREQILYTISARLNGKTGFRATAGHSLHDMYTAAGLPCACRRCQSTATAPAIAAALVPPVATQAEVRPPEPVPENQLHDQPC